MTATDVSRRASAQSQPARQTRRRYVRFECELNDGICPLTGLREALVREAKLLAKKDQWIEQQAILSREADHRLLNNLQMVSSLLSAQSRATQSVEAAAALTHAAARVAMIGRIHRQLHSSDGARTVAFKHFIEELCRDVAAMATPDRTVAQVIAVEGAELQLPTTIGIPLGFVVNELITNALKYGAGRITVGLKRDRRKGFALSVENDGPALAQAFDPAASKSLSCASFDHS